MTDEEILIKLHSKTEIQESTGCWLWKGSRNQLGYGRINIDSKNKYVHREGFRVIKGEPKSLVLHDDKLCSNKNCWNPEHLYDGTYTENRFDTISKYGGRLSKYCKNGHEYTKENTKLDYKKHRQCITCYKTNNERLKARKRVAILRSLKNTIA